MSEHTDIRVRTSNPAWLDETLNQLPNVACGVVKGSWDGDACVVRVLEGDPGFVKFAIINQGYGEVIGS